MYKVLSRLKYRGEVYEPGDEVDLKPNKLGKQLTDEGVVEVSEKTPAERRAEEKARKKDEREKAEREKKDSVKEYEDMDDKELVNTLEARGIDHKDLSREDAIKALKEDSK